MAGEAEPPLAMIREVSGGIVVDVRVATRSGASGLAGTRDGALLVRLHAPPVDGAANAELLGVIAAAFEVPKRAVSIVSGARSRLKRVRVEGLDAHAATRRLSGGMPR